MFDVVAQAVSGVSSSKRDEGAVSFRRRSGRKSRAGLALVSRGAGGFPTDPSRSGSHVSPSRFAVSSASL